MQNNRRYIADILNILFRQENHRIRQNYIHRPPKHSVWYYGIRMNQISSSQNPQDNWCSDPSVSSAWHEIPHRKLLKINLCMILLLRWIELFNGINGFTLLLFCMHHANREGWLIEILNAGVCSEWVSCVFVASGYVSVSTILRTTLDAFCRFYHLYSLPAIQWHSINIRFA